MRSSLKTLQDEKGFALVTTVVILLLLVIIGVAATTTSITELQIAGADKVHTMSFYAAEAGRSWVRASPEFYGSANIIAGEGLNFPDKSVYPSQAGSSGWVSLGPDQAFQGRVVYQGSSTTRLRGTGFEAGEFIAHEYEMEIAGTGPNKAATRIAAGFYRVGF